MLFGSLQPTTEFNTFEYNPLQKAVRINNIPSAIIRCRLRTPLTATFTVGPDGYLKVCLSLEAEDIETGALQLHQWEDHPLFFA